MNNISFELNKFYHSLQLMADPGYAVSVEHGQLAIINAQDRAHGSLEEKVQAVASYIHSHNRNLRPRDQELIQRIGKKLSQEIDLKKESAASPSLVFRVAAAPKNWEEFQKHLKLIIQHFPRFQFHNDLSLYDTKYYGLPQKWNFEEMHATLIAAFDFYEQQLSIKEDLPQLDSLQSIKSEIIHLYKQPTPIQMGIIIETSGPNTTATALWNDFILLGEQRKPIIVNRQFFQAHADAIKSNWNFLKVLPNYDLYVQKTGGLCLWIPKNQSPQMLGFQAEEMEMWNQHDFLVPALPPLNFAQDIESILFNETDKQRFFRLITLNGHGGYPGYPKALDEKSPGTIAGLKTPEFQKGFLALQKKNISFLHVSSCFAGGTNALHIHLPDGSIPCPIYVGSSFDITAKTSLNKEYDPIPILEKAEKLIFPSGFFLAAPRQLVPTNMKKLGDAVKISDPSDAFSNLGSLFLPTQRADIPRVAHTLSNSEEVLDISRAYQNENLKALAKPLANSSRPLTQVLQPLKTPLPLLQDNHSHRKAYLFSNPILPFSLSTSLHLPMILLSRGGHAHHVIQEIQAPHQDIELIGQETFNAMSLRDLSELQPAYKAFFIGHFRCRFQGKEMNLSRVVIKNTNNEREIIFQLPGEDIYHRMKFKKESIALTNNISITAWNKEAHTETLSPSEGIQVIYLAAFKSKPSPEALLQATAGRLSEEDFVEALDAFFFSGEMPIEAKLRSALLKDMLRNQSTPGSQKSAHLNAVLDDLKKGDHSKSEREEILRQAIDFILAVDPFDSILQKQMKLLTYTPLMFAVESKDLQKVKEILHSHPSTLEETQINGSSALSMALLDKQWEISQFLIEKGARLDTPNRFGWTAFTVACSAGDTDFLDWLFQIKRPIQGRDVARTLKRMIIEKKLDVAARLINEMPLEGDLLDLVFDLAALPEGSRLVAQLIQRYKNTFDLNQRRTNFENTALHIGVYYKHVANVKVLLEHGADPNIKNKKGSSPLHFAAFAKEGSAIELATALIQAKAEVNAQNNDGDTTLHMAVRNKDKEFVQFLIKNGARPHIKNKKQETPLSLAMASLELIDACLQCSGVDVNQEDAYQETLFQKAVMKGDLPLASLLLKRGAKINQFFQKDPPLCAYLARANSNPTMVQFFIDNGARLDLTNPLGNNPMHYAMRNKQIFEMLLKAGLSYRFPANRAGQTPFQIGLEALDKEVFNLLLEQTDLLEQNISEALRLLIKRGNMVDSTALFRKAVDLLIAQKSTEPSLLLHYAILQQNPQAIEDWFKQNPHIKPARLYDLHPIHTALFFGGNHTEELFKALLKHIPDINKKYDGQIIVQLVNDYKPSLPLTKMLIDHGADMDMKTSSFIGLRAFDEAVLRKLQERGVDFSGQWGYKFLKQAIANKDAASLAYLFSLGAKEEKGSLDFGLLAMALYNYPEAVQVLLKNAKKIDIHGYPLKAAIHTSNLGMLKWLLENKACFEKNPMHASPLHFLLSENHPKQIEMASMLIDNGLDINLANEKDGDTPLHIAIKSDQIESVKVLIAKGARWDIPNKAGLTAKRLASKLRLAHYLPFMQDV